jgi:hypothetical protein
VGNIAGVTTDPGSDAFDEQAALEEIGLYAELLIAADRHDGPLPADEIDRALGLQRAGSDDKPTSTSTGSAGPGSG